MSEPIKRQKIEDAINEFIEDKTIKELMLDFILWLRKNKMSPTWSAKNYWKFSYKKSKVFLIRLGKNEIIIERFWLPWTSDECQLFISNNNLQNLVWDNMTICGRFEDRRCGGCPPSDNFTGISLNICEKEAENICRGAILKIVNPEYKTIEEIKKLLEYNMCYTEVK